MSIENTEIFKDINIRLSQFCSISEEQINNRLVTVNGLTLLKLRDILIEMGTIIEEDLDNNIYAAYLPAGFMKKNLVITFFQLSESTLCLASYAKEGAIKQGTVEQAQTNFINKIKEYIVNSDGDGAVETTEDVPNANRKNLFKRLFSAVLLFLATVVVINCIQKEKYKSSYNIYVNEYNTYAESIDYILKNYPETDIGVSKVEPKEKLIGLSSANTRVKSDNLTLIKQETDNLKKSLERLENDVYYTNAKELNQEIQNYQYMSKLIKPYSMDIKVEDLQIKPLNTNKNDVLTWENFDDFKSDIDEINQQKKSLDKSYYDLAIASYDSLVSDYNIIADAYNEIASKSVVTYIEGMSVELNNISAEKITNNYSKEKLIAMIDDLINKTQAAIDSYSVINQITNPSEESVKTKLEKVSKIKSIQAVTKEKDPNNLLGKKGGYKSCLYFEVKGIKSDFFNNKDTIEKGTDGGGAIEIYNTSTEALNRCDYLSQFDGTILYTGSYTVVGTMVIRTTYLLDSKQQVELTNDIIHALTSNE